MGYPFYTPPQKPSGPMSPVPGPMDLANNPMLVTQLPQQGPAGGVGMLDPRVGEAYQSMDEARKLREERMAQYEPERESKLRSFLEVLPAVAMGIATGGAAIPAALAYASAAGMADYQGDKATRKAWEIEEADRIFEGRKAQLDAADKAFGATAVSASNLQAKQGEKNWLIFNPRSGQFVDSGMPIKANRDQLGAFGKFAQEIYGKPLEELTPEEREKALVSFQTSKQQRMFEDAAQPGSTVPQGAAAIEGAKEEATRTVENQWQNWAAVTDVASAIPEWDSSIEILDDYLAKMESGEIDASAIIGGLEQYWSSNAARLIRLNNAETLSALSEQTLVPVSDKDIEVLKSSIFNPSIPQEQRIAMFRDYIADKKRKAAAIKKKARALGDAGLPAGRSLDQFDVFQSKFDAEAELESL